MQWILLEFDASALMGYSYTSTFRFCRYHPAFAVFPPTPNLKILPALALLHSQLSSGHLCQLRLSVPNPLPKPPRRPIIRAQPKAYTLNVLLLLGTEAKRFFLNRILSNTSLLRIPTSLLTGISQILHYFPPPLPSTPTSFSL